MIIDPNSIEYRNPKYNKYGGIDCEIYNKDFDEWMAYTASPKIDKYDKEGINRTLFERIKNEGNAQRYVPYIPPAEFYINYAKAERDRLLTASDWSQLPDVPEGVKARWVEYRQYLRDITNQPGYPREINWPIYDPDGNPTLVIWPPEV